MDPSQKWDDEYDFIMFSVSQRSQLKCSLCQMMVDEDKTESHIAICPGKSGPVGCFLFRITCQEDIPQFLNVPGVSDMNEMDKPTYSSMSINIVMSV